jgi:hypothetical protein
MIYTVDAKSVLGWLIQQWSRELTWIDAVAIPCPLLHLPYCRQNLVGSLPRGMPKVVDYRQTGVQAMNEMVMQNNAWVYPGSGRRMGVIPYVLLCFVIAISNNVLQARLP